MSDEVLVWDYTRGDVIDARTGVVIEERFVNPSGVKQLEIEPIEYVPFRGVKKVKERRLVEALELALGFIASRYPDRRAYTRLNRLAEKIVTRLANGKSVEELAATLIRLYSKIYCVPITLCEVGEFALCRVHEATNGACVAYDRLCFVTVLAQRAVEELGLVDSKPILPIVSLLARVFARKSHSIDDAVAGYAVYAGALLLGYDIRMDDVCEVLCVSSAQLKRVKMNVASFVNTVNRIVYVHRKIADFVYGLLGVEKPRNVIVR